MRPLIRYVSVVSLFLAGEALVACVGEPAPPVGHPGSMTPQGPSGAPDGGKGEPDPPVGRPGSMMLPQVAPSVQDAGSVTRVPGSPSK